MKYTPEQIEAAKQLLWDSGYLPTALWHMDDIKESYENHREGDDDFPEFSEGDFLMLKQKVEDGFDEEGQYSWDLIDREVEVLAKQKGYLI